MARDGARIVAPARGRVLRSRIGAQCGDGETVAVGCTGITGGGVGKRQAKRMAQVGWLGNARPRGDEPGAYCYAACLAAGHCYLVCRLAAGTTTMWGCSIRTRIWHYKRGAGMERGGRGTAIVRDDGALGAGRATPSVVVPLPRFSGFAARAPKQIVKRPFLSHLKDLVLAFGAFR
jgi:hypothetical protein